MSVVAHSLIQRKRCEERTRGFGRRCFACDGVRDEEQRVEPYEERTRSSKLRKRVMDAGWCWMVICKMRPAAKQNPDGMQQAACRHVPRGSWSREGAPSRT